MTPAQIEGQLNQLERNILTAAILEAPQKPEVVIEVGTWLGGGSTLHIFKGVGAEWQRAFVGYRGGSVHLRTDDHQYPDVRLKPHNRFTPLFGFSQRVLPQWLAEQKEGLSN